jgi:CheY-like chemotaxis protein
MASSKQARSNGESRVPDPQSRIQHHEAQVPSPEPRVPNPKRGMAGRILVIVDDLFFLAKIREAAKQLDVELDTTRPEAASEKLVEGNYVVVILDLNHRSGKAIEILQAIKKNPLTQSAPVLGFLSHVQGELAAAARASGCDAVMARSAFSQRLPEVLSKYARS